MKKYVLILLILLFSRLAVAQNYKTHTVKDGETISSIAKMYLITPFDIYALNPKARIALDANTILVIPNTRVKNDPVQESVKELVGFRNHKVKRKQTLYSISKQYNIEVDDIKKYNERLYSENLRRGDRIKIPKFKTIINKVSLSNTIKKYIKI